MLMVQASVLNSMVDQRFSKLGSILSYFLERGSSSPVSKLRSKPSAMLASSAPRLFWQLKLNPHWLHRWN